jgi:hypothetical protein
MKAIVILVLDVEVDKFLLDEKIDRQESGRLYSMSLKCRSMRWHGKIYGETLPDGRLVQEYNLMKR